MDFLIAISIPVLAAILAGVVATRKNRNRVGWAIGTFLFVPAIVIVLLPPPLPDGDSSAAAA